VSIARSLCLPATDTTAFCVGGPLFTLNSVVAGLCVSPLALRARRPSSPFRLTTAQSPPASGAIWARCPFDDGPGLPRPVVAGPETQLPKENLHATTT
jgi:hypothetical protein